MGGYGVSLAICTGVKQWDHIEDYFALMYLKGMFLPRSTPVATCHSFCLVIALEAVVSASRKDLPLVRVLQ